MKLDEVKVGGRYHCKVSGKQTIVRITAIEKGEKGGYRRAMTHFLAINEKTNREVTIKSARKLDREVKA